MTSDRSCAGVRNSSIALIYAPKSSDSRAARYRTPRGCLLFAWYSLTTQGFPLMAGIFGRHALDLECDHGLGDRRRPSGEVRSIERRARSLAAVFRPRQELHHVDGPRRHVGNGAFLDRDTRHAIEALGAAVFRTPSLAL